MYLEVLLTEGSIDDESPVGVGILHLRWEESPGFSSIAQTKLQPLPYTSELTPKHLPVAGAKALKAIPDCPLPLTPHLKPSDIPGGGTLNTSQGVCCTREEIRKMMDIVELAQEVLLPTEPSPHPATSDINLQVHSPEMVSGTETNWAYYLECD